jgi:hypothetical protein
MKINLAKTTGKFTGKLFSATKAAPTKTKNGIVSVKEQFQAGFNQGSNNLS